MFDEYDNEHSTKYKTVINFYCGDLELFLIVSIAFFSLIMYPELIFRIRMSKYN